MDDKLILAVFNYPELYNATLPNYRCTQSRANAWKNISLTLGLPTDECKRKWKNMRDRYLKEVRLEIKSKSLFGETVQSRWRYRQLMNFIAPFTGSRVGLTDMSPEDDQDNHDTESGSAEGDTPTPEVIKTPQSCTKTNQLNQTDIKPQIASVAQDAQIAQLAALAKISSSISPIINKPGRKRRFTRDSFPSTDATNTNAAELSSKWLLKDNGPSPAATRPRDEDELFLLSFVPALKRLAPQKRCETKIRIQQIMYEAEFNVFESEKLSGDAQD
ncbi:transcription factor Adf-1-like [Periophthalmus magnuspinnatus]|uniref:transcription factor Adf-1-like n=1 Tax=Periophthalmus magnuspinnatus TaxID=409849 RepID=UPI00145A26E9|nr:transcription factor Adf-1-like [Periophthalmus magnuspinnatus]